MSTATIVALLIVIVLIRNRSMGVLLRELTRREKRGKTPAVCRTKFGAEYDRVLAADRMVIPRNAETVARAEGKSRRRIQSFDPSGEPEIAPNLRGTVERDTGTPSSTRRPRPWPTPMKS